LWLKLFLLSTFLLFFHFSIEANRALVMLDLFCRGRTLRRTRRPFHCNFLTITSIAVKQTGLCRGECNPNKWQNQETKERKIHTFPFFWFVFFFQWVVVDSRIVLCRGARKIFNNSLLLFMFAIFHSNFRAGNPLFFLAVGNCTSSQALYVQKCVVGSGLGVTGIECRGLDWRNVRLFFVTVVITVWYTCRW